MLFPKASAGRQVCLPRNFWHFWRIWSRIFWRICSRVLHAHQPFCSSLHIDGVSTENFFVRDVGSTTGLASSSDATRLYEVVSHGQVQADLDADRGNDTATNDPFARAFKREHTQARSPADLNTLSDKTSTHRICNAAQ